MLMKLLREKFVEARVARCTHIVAHDSTGPAKPDSVTDTIAFLDNDDVASGEDDEAVVRGTIQIVLHACPLSMHLQHFLGNANL